MGAYDDYVQWRTAGNSGQGVANLYGLWEPGTFVDGLPPYVFEGDAYADPAEHGVDLWSAQPYPCTIADMDVGEASPCNPDETFTQALRFALLSPPAANDNIWVNDSMLVYDGSNPWNVVLSVARQRRHGTSLSPLRTIQHARQRSTIEVVAPEGCAMPYDLNGGGFVDVTDVLIFLTDYGCLSGCTADFNGDDIVNTLTC